ncbi:hypothetical protein AB0B13_35475, partial [Streptomyces sp. NPDC042898]
MLINPNTSTATTAMMTAIARRTLRELGAPTVRGVTVSRGPGMLTDPAAQLSWRETYLVLAAILAA